MRLPQPYTKPATARLLSEKQKEYITANHCRMFVTEMATNLKIHRKTVKKYMERNNLSMKSPRARKPINHINLEIKEGFFNVNQFDNWLI